MKAGVNRRLFELMEQATAGGVFPGAVLLVECAGRLFHSSAHGRLGYYPEAPAVTPDTVYDLASLTKPLVTASVALVLEQAGRLPLDQPVGRWLGWHRPVSELTCRQLLRHSSGLCAWRPYYQEVAAAAPRAVSRAQGLWLMRKLVAAEKPLFAPDQKELYSDLGYMLLHWILEEAGGATLTVLFRRLVLHPLGLGGLFFIDLKRTRRPPDARQAPIAPTELCPWRGRLLEGEVHDDNAYVMGGVSGHAGLFGSAPAVLQLAWAWLQSWAGERRGPFTPDGVRRFWEKSPLAGASHTMGFDTPSGENSQAGRLMGPRTVGHTGFTGTSFWIDPDRRLVVVMLSNRVHPRRDNLAIRDFRPRLHQAVVEEVDR